MELGLAKDDRIDLELSHRF